MNSFYRTIQYLADELLSDIDVNTVIHGDIIESKKDIYPLGHLQITSGRLAQGMSVFSFTVRVVDIRNTSKIATVDKFTGNDNELDSLNTCFAVLSRLVLRLKNQSNDEDIMLLNDPSFTPIELQYKEMTDGWSVDLEIGISNNISEC